MKPSPKPINPQNVVGQFVILKEDFLHFAHQYDPAVPIKIHRPFLVLPLAVEGQPKKQLFAVPMQSNVKNIKNNLIYTQLCYRLESYAGSPSGLIYSQMIPITTNQIAAIKTTETTIPTCRNKRGNVIRNLHAWDGKKLPSVAQSNFLLLKQMMENCSGDKMKLFDDEAFQTHYQLVANAIYQDTVRLKNTKLTEITQKAERYLTEYYAFKRYAVNKHGKKNKHEFRCGIPKMHTRIDQLLDFVKAYNRPDFLQQTGRWVKPKTSYAQQRDALTRRQRNDRYFDEIDAEFNYQKPCKKKHQLNLTQKNSALKSAQSLPKHKVDSERSL